VDNKVVEADAKDPYLEFFNLNENDMKNFDKTAKKKVNKKKVVTGKGNLGNFLA
jgi:hypothetical protein